VADSQPPLQHIGFIVDGNRRWAAEQGKGPQFGHKHGAQRLKDIAKHLNQLGIPYGSAYVFSTENWKRAKEEVNYLMELVVKLVERDLEELYQEGVRLLHIGSRDGVPPKTLRAIDRAVEKTADNTGLTLGLCLNYGGHQEIVDAVNAATSESSSVAAISEQDISDHLYGSELPPLDLVIRTSGEQRLSNFMLWRASYAELYFTDTHWPDFDEAGVDAALEWYQQRQRRFGGN